MNTIENNKLIAEFMGLQLEQEQDRIFIKGLGTKLIEETFNTDWNWLMEVVQKIKIIDSKAIGSLQLDLLHYQRNNKTIFDLYILEEKEYVYSACIDFINWYNNQNK